MWETRVFPGGRMDIRFEMTPGDEDEEDEPNRETKDIPSSYVITTGTTLREVMPPIITWALAMDPNREAGRLFEGFHRQSPNEAWEVVWGT